MYNDANANNKVIFSIYLGCICLYRDRDHIIASGHLTRYVSKVLKYHKKSFDNIFQQKYARNFSKKDNMITHITLVHKKKPKENKLQSSREYNQDVINLE
jgi:hypothetical protein